jgi:hypothetical protein
LNNRLNSSFIDEHGTKSIQGIEPVVRDPWMVVWGNPCVETERFLLLAAGFMPFAGETIQIDKNPFKGFCYFLTIL